MTSTNPPLLDFSLCQEVLEFDPNVVVLHSEGEGYAFVEQTFHTIVRGKEGPVVPMVYDAMFGTGMVAIVPKSHPLNVAEDMQAHYCKPVLALAASGQNRPQTGEISAWIWENGAPYASKLFRVEGLTE